MADPKLTLDAEWLETDGLGGFASGTVSTRRTRRYHAWLLAARHPPTDRFVLVNGGDIWIETVDHTQFLSRQYYAPDIAAPYSPADVESFAAVPWPTWHFLTTAGLQIRQELLVVKRRAATILRWSLANDTNHVAMLRVRLLLSGRDYHSLHHQNRAFQFMPQEESGVWRWSVYSGVPEVLVTGNARYLHQPEWYRRFIYVAEQERGLDCEEDLAAPGIFEWNISQGPAVLLLTADPEVICSKNGRQTPADWIQELIENERRRRQSYATRHHQTADDYIVRRRAGSTIIAGYPWFTDWGRDTFISIRGLCLALQRWNVAEEILLSWANHVSEGMLPNRFPDAGECAEYNSVDASLWYVIAAAEFLEQAHLAAYDVKDRVRETILNACLRILHGYAMGTRHGIRRDDDGLLLAGEPGVQLTWMDVKIGDRVITPRAGKPVEIQALWLNALSLFSSHSKTFAEWYQVGRAAFARKFWNAEHRCLFDVVDVDGIPGDNDASIRPNQIFAVGGLPEVLLSKDQSRAVVSLVERELWTPFGLRTLSQAHPDYHGHYSGGAVARDEAYHQGTVWPWLLGPFIEALLRVNEFTVREQDVNERYLKTLSEYDEHIGFGHLPEVADGDWPHRPGGCPCQAWSLGELIRVQRLLKNSTKKIPLI